MTMKARLASVLAIAGVSISHVAAWGQAGRYMFIATVLKQKK